jgi:hypothetical protein
MIPTEQLHDLAYGGEPGTRRLTLPDGTPAVLTCRREWRGLSRLALGLLARGWRAPELRQAGQLFRSARRGEPAPRLLGFGQRLHTGGRVDSFLLVADDAMVEVPA